MSWSRFLLSSVCCSLIFFTLPVLTVQASVYLSPAKQEITMSPGEQRSVTVLIENRGTTAITFSVDVEDVGAGLDSKTAVIPLGQRVPGESSLAAYTLLLNTSLTLAPGAQQTVEAQIALPQNVTPGGHYGALMFATAPRATTTAAARIVTRLGALLFVRVAGDIKEEGTLARFAPRSGKLFSSSTKLPLVLEYKNTGNVHLNPYGVVTLTPWWGKNVRTFAVDPWYILPGGTRSRDVLLSHIRIPGRYLVTLELNRGYKNSVDVRTISVWIFPWQWVAGLIGISIVLGLWWYFVRMKTR